MFKCQYCEYSNQYRGPLGRHQVSCKSNPNRVPGKNGAYYGWTGSDEMKKRCSVASTGRNHSDGSKNKLAEIARNRGLGGTTGKKTILYNGVYFDSSYELRLAQDLDRVGVEWTRPKGLPYIDPFGKKRTYRADFYLPGLNVYLDPKNDFLIESVNPSMGFSDKEKVRLVQEQNDVVVLILNKDQLTYNAVEAQLVVQSPCKR